MCLCVYLWVCVGFSVCVREMEKGINVHYTDIHKFLCVQVCGCCWRKMKIATFLLSLYFVWVLFVSVCICVYSFRASIQTWFPFFLFFLSHVGRVCSKTDEKPASWTAINWLNTLLLKDLQVSLTLLPVQMFPCIRASRYTMLLLECMIMFVFAFPIM